jgi:hypothetical protein
VDGRRKEDLRGKAAKTLKAKLSIKNIRYRIGCKNIKVRAKYKKYKT